MEWFMIIFLAALAVILTYYIYRQANDPGIALFPFNSTKFDTKPAEIIEAAKNQVDGPQK